MLSPSSATADWLWQSGSHGDRVAHRPLAECPAPLDFAFLPPDLSLSGALALVVLSFVTSLITATLSLGGGMLMLAVLALVFPPAVVVPVHGLVQLGSNAGRALVQHRYVQWQLVLWFGLGTLVGSFLGARFAVALPEALFQAVIGVFIIFNAWAPQPRVSGRGPLGNFVGGVVISALGMVIGATGPLVANFMRGLSDRHELVATHAALMTWSNSAKVGAFALFGFAFGAYLPLAAAMIATGFLGTYMGSQALARVPETVFRVGFKLVLTLAALQILWSAASALPWATLTKF